LDNYDANVYKIATGFAQPIDIVVDENIIWLAEYGDGVNRGLWKITMPCGDAAVCGTVTPPLPPPPPPTPTPTLSCDAINVEGGEGQINITGLTAPIEIVQVFDANYSPIFRCEGGDCGAEQLLTDLGEGDYIVGVQLYTANWAFICEKTNITVTVTGGENPPPPPPPSTGSANCEALTFTAEADQIIVSGLNTTYSQVEIIGQNTAWQIVPICAGDCAETQIIPNLTEGEYNVKVQLNASDGTNCYREEKVSGRKSNGWWYNFSSSTIAVTPSN